MRKNKKSIKIDIKGLNLKKGSKMEERKEIDPQTFRKIIKFLIQKFVNLLTINGKKEKAEQILLESLHIIQILEKKESISLVFKAIEKVKPTLELRSIRRGGATYQVPIPSRQGRGISLALKWLIESAHKKKNTFSLSLAQVIIEASKDLGENIKKRQNLDATGLKNRGLGLISRF